MSRAWRAARGAAGGILDDDRATRCRQAPTPDVALARTAHLSALATSTSRTSSSILRGDAVAAAAPGIAASECLTHRDQSDPSCVDLLELVTVVTESVRNCAPGGHAACAACLVALPRYGSVEVRIAFAKNMSRQTRLVLGQYWPNGQREVEDRAMRRI